ncbi:MAG: LCP family protein [Actinomycetota bacterium]|nr:LCP family protein [Actinomycetota bacterium]
MGPIIRLLAYLFLLVVVLGLIAAAAAAYLHFRIKGNEEVVGGLTSDEPAEPMNVLVLGSDSRQDLTPEQRQRFGTLDVVPGKRADTIILLHLDEKRRKAVLVHFPRDLRVTDPAGRVGKINEVYGQGPEAVVRTVAGFTGLPLHHYVEVDFNGFNRITDALGGVEVYFEKPLKDPKSGLDVPRGCVTIQGDQALAFVRARMIDDDFGRIARQQLYLKLMMDKVAAPGTLLQPAKVVKLINIFSENVKHDADLDLGDIQKIALRVRSFNSRNIDMRVVPSTVARIGGVSYVVADEAKARALFAAIASGESLPDYGRTEITPIVPEDVKLSVLNGTQVATLAADEAAGLESRGFSLLETANAGPHRATTVYYFEGFEQKARFVAASYGAEVKEAPPSLEANEDAEVVLVLGDDLAAGRLSGESARPAASPPTQPPAHGLTPGPANGRAGGATPEANRAVRACDG